MPTFYFETFGCQMNVADSDLLASALTARGYDKTENSCEADILVVNTCSVRQHAETRALSHIAQHAAHKRQNRRRQSIWVIGCMAQRLGNALAKQVPGVDRVVGARDFEAFLLELDAHLGVAHPTSALDGHGGNDVSGAVSRFVPIMRGCNNYCAYCVVPLVRGPEASVPAAAIEETIQLYIDKGVKEITLLGQNVNSYRDGETDFAGLLRRLHGSAGCARIRFTTSHPKDCTESLIRTMAELPALCRHIHLPVQSGSSRVLARMNRRYSRDDYLRLIDMIRKHLPAADITTDAMVGFPTESRQDFLDTLSLFKQVRFTTAFMFMYSKRENTAAFSMGDDVGVTEKKQRLRELIDCQTSITKEMYQAMVGKKLSVLFTGQQDGGERLWMGQDDGCKRVLVPCDTPLAGMILPIRATKSSGMTLIGEKE
jgi:tRNA-2-methylthio-N6-dimethylallyladenosine synthase